MSGNSFDLILMDSNRVKKTNRLKGREEKWRF